MLNRLPVFLVGAWKKDGSFYTPYEYCVTNSQNTATEILRKAIREKSSFQHDLHYNIYKLSPDNINDTVIDNSELEFYENVQKVLEPLNLRSHITFDKLILEANNKKPCKHIDTYTSLSYTFDVNTKTIILSVSTQCYKSWTTREEEPYLQQAHQDIINSLYCVEIPKIKKVLRELNSDIRVSIVGRNKRKLIPGFITK